MEFGGREWHGGKKRNFIKYRGTEDVIWWEHKAVAGYGFKEKMIFQWRLKRGGELGQIRGVTRDEKKKSTAIEKYAGGARRLTWKLTQYVRSGSGRSSLVLPPTSYLQPVFFGVKY